MTPIDYNPEFNDIETVLQIANTSGLNKSGTKPPAMAYVQDHDFDDIYEASEALFNGTMFKELNLPFLGRRVSEKNE